MIYQKYEESFLLSKKRVEKLVKKKKNPLRSDGAYLWNAEKI